MEKTNLIQIFRNAIKQFLDDEPIKLAGSLSFLTIFAIPPILVIVTTLLGFIFNEELIYSKLYLNIRDFIGPKVDKLFAELLLNYKKTPATFGRTFATIFMFIIATTTFFATIQHSLNKIFQVEHKKKKIIRTVTHRLQSVLIIIGISVLFLISMLIDTSMVLFKNYLDSILPDLTFIVLRITKILISLIATTTSFALLFKILPDMRIKWKIVFKGGFITSLLFAVGEFLIVTGIKSFGIAAMYGTVGTFVVFLLWVFYSSLIFYFGAEITHQFYKVSVFKND